MIRIKRGLDIPISGAPEQKIDDSRQVKSVALLGQDYVGMKPTMEVREGERVKLGQLLFTDKKTEGVRYTSPGTGTVRSINRGARRAFLSLIIDLDGDQSEQETFARYTEEELKTLSRGQIVENLVNSGEWTALRTRPYGKVPAPDSKPSAIFVNAMDSNPLAADPQLVVGSQVKEFVTGINLLSRLTEGTLYVCRRAGAFEGLENEGFAANVNIESFAGPHPAGLTGTHIHFLHPVGLKRQVWTISYQDVIAIARLFLSGSISTERVVALGGPQVNEPRLLRTRTGANLQELAAGQLKDGENRIISGSVLAGRNAAEPENFLGRYHQQISVVREGREREMFGYLSPGLNRHSNLGIYLSSLFGKGKKLNMTTTTNGSERAMVPVGTYETIMPLDILPTQLLRALIVGDIATVISLGGLELEEEDIALCTYVCPGKYEYGPILRRNLTQIEKEMTSAE